MNRSEWPVLWPWHFRNVSSIMLYMLFLVCNFTWNENVDCYHSLTSINFQTSCEQRSIFIKIIFMFAFCLTSQHSLTNNTIISLPFCPFSIHILHDLILIPFSSPFFSSNKLWKVSEATCGFPQRLESWSTFSSNLIQRAVSFHSICSPFFVSSSNSTKA